MKIINLEKSKEAILEDVCNFLTNAQTTSPLRSGLRDNVCIGEILIFPVAGR